MSVREQNDLVERFCRLSQNEKREVLMKLEDITRQSENTTKKRSIMELKGLGKEIWAGIDAQEYIDRERDSWDG